MYLWDLKANYVETVESRVVETAQHTHQVQRYQCGVHCSSGFYLSLGIKFLIFNFKPVMDTGHCSPNDDDNEEEEEEEEEIDDIDDSSSSPPLTPSSSSSYSLSRLYF